MALANHYNTLGLRFGASDEAVKIAYRKLSKKFHPDLNDGDKFFEERFREIQGAYEVLSSPSRKEDYIRRFMAENDGTTQNPNSNFKAEQRTSSPKQENVPPKTNYQNQKSSPPNSTGKDSKRTGTAILAIIAIVCIGFIRNAVNHDSYKSPISQTPTSYSDIPPAPSPFNNMDRKDSNLGNTDTLQEVPAAADSAKMKIEPIYNGTAPNAASYTNLPDNVNSSDDGSDVSDVDTKNWILEKLRNYRQKSVICDLFAPPGTNNCCSQDGYAFWFVDGVLNVAYNRDDKYRLEAAIPIWDLQNVTKEDGSILFSMNTNTIVERNLTERTQSIHSRFYVGLRTDSEPELVERLRKAFLHYKNFYQRHPSRESF